MGLIEFTILLTSIVVCVTVHEAAHAWVAFKLGDPTPKMQDRVSLNPVKHMDLFGTFMIFFAHFGWGKPVQFNPNNLRYPRLYAAVISLVGPLANLFTAFLIGLLLKYVSITGFFKIILDSIYILSIRLFLFNMIPIAPLDGSKLLGLFIPSSKKAWYMNYMSQGPIYLILIIVADRMLAYSINFSFIGYYLVHGVSILDPMIQLGS